MKTYKILKVIELCHPRIDQFYEDHPGLKDLSYVEHKQALFEQRFVHYNNFVGCMEGLGQQADLVITDAIYLQEQWAREHNLDLDREYWLFDVLMHQIETYRPDVLYLQDKKRDSIFSAETLKKIFPFIKLVVMFKGSRNDAHQIYDVDLVLASAPGLCDDFKTQGAQVELLYHAFDDSVLPYLSHIQPQESHEIAFMGASGYGLRAVHADRYWLLDELAQQTNIQLWISENLSMVPVIDRGRLHMPKGFQPMDPLTQKYPGRCFVPVYGQAYYQGLKNARISLNHHTEVAGGIFPNMRVFETMGVGGCLLSNSGDQMRQLFEPDVEYMDYKNTEECLEKIAYLLDHPDQRKQMRKKGQQAVLDRHTLRHQCEAINHYLQERL